MWLSGQWFGSEVVKRITAAVAADPSLTRTALSRLVCDWLDWRAPDGRLREVACRKALVELERRGVVTLPEGGRSATDLGISGWPVVKTAEVSCSLAELGAIEIVVVTSQDKENSALWNGLMSTHYLGVPRLRGAQMRYLVESSVCGPLGALAFDAATWALADRDHWIGWTERARRTNLERVICNSRFLIASGVQVPNLASWTLAAATRRLSVDWLERYGYEPVLIETFVDPARFAGTCYQAANWESIGATAGARNDSFANGRSSTGTKNIYAYPLRQDFRDVLTAEPQDCLALRGDPLGNDVDWVDIEFASARVFDPRLRRRLATITRDFYAQPGASIPQACDGDPAKEKAAYRFFSNDKIDMKSLLKGHLETTAVRMTQHDVVLCVQDTTSLNYTTHRSVDGFGPIGSTQNKAVGLIVHDTMAFDTDGMPLGLIDVQCWARPNGPLKKQSACTPIEEKESFKWIRSYRATAEVAALCCNTTVVSVGDREADIHELFSEAQRTEAGPKLLIRAERTRCRKIADSGYDHEYLWEKVPAGPVAGTLQIQIPRSGTRRARTATLQVRHAPVTLMPPKGKDLDPVQVWVVHARENDAPEEATPLEWMLLTTVGVADFDDAVERLRWYALRWSIEVYHRVIKSGCRIEDRQLGNINSIEACLVIDMVVAWRIYHLTKLARETPEQPCDVFFVEDEWKALLATVRPNEAIPAEPPTIRDAARMTAKLGGFLGRKGDGEPGTTTLWRGLGRLDNIVIGWHAAQRQRAP